MGFRGQTAIQCGRSGSIKTAAVGTWRCPVCRATRCCWMVLLYNVLYHCLKDISPSVGEGHTIKFNTVQSNFRSGRLDGCWDQEGGNGNATLHNYQWNELRAPFLCAARCILVGSLSCLLLRSVDVTLALFIRQRRIERCKVVCVAA